MKTKVLCLIKHVYEKVDMDEQEVWLDIEPNYKYLQKIEYVLPLYNHPHNDIENGQEEIHYHQDTRYDEAVKNSSKFSSFRNGRIVLPLLEGEFLAYRELNKVREKEDFTTPIRFINNSKLKHKCIHKGKCPHRGYDLTNVKPLYDKEYDKYVIKCPLHGLKFDLTTKELINFKIK